jgi:SPP1 gp7 family putative phage head morphogenesis protein
MDFKAAWKALWSVSSPSPQGMMAGVSSGMQRAPRRGTRELMVAYREQPWLRAIIQRISQDVASVPFRLLAPTRAAGTGLVSRAIGASRTVRQKILSDGLAGGALQELESHPLLTLVNTMNPALRAVGSFTVTQAFLDLKGEAFWVLERNGAGQAVEAWPVPPHWVTETPSVNNPTYRMSAYGWTKQIPENDVLWFRTPDLENPYGRGSGIGEALADEIDVDEFAAKHVRDWFFNGGRPSGFVSLQGAGEDEVTRFEEKWKSRYQGIGRAHQIHFTNAAIGYEDLSHTFKDQELLALRQYQADLMRQTFGVPPEILGILENSNRATIDSSFYLYAKGVLTPRLVAMCDALQGLASEFDSRLVVDFVSPVPDDLEFKKSAMVALPTNFTVNEHRALAGQSPIDGGDVLFAVAPPPSPIMLAQEPIWTKTVGVWKASKGIDDVVDAIDGDKLKEKAEPVNRRRLRRWVETVLMRLEVDNVEEILSKQSLTRDALQESSEKITNTNETTKQAVRDALEEGVMAGEGIEKLRKRVEEVFEDATAKRARTIARTEVVGSANKANLAAYVASGVVTAKEWLSVPDANTRDEHRGLDGQIVGIDAQFVTPMGARTAYPGGFGVGALDINCRCAMLPVTELSPEGRSSPFATTKEQREAEWKAFDKAAVSWEGELEKALRQAYDEQRDAALAVFDATFGKAAGGRRKAVKRQAAPKPRAPQGQLLFEL